ncbi:hypothetical protein K431DRAFT_85396 [Polychaeton citri CBS 116435]|uniref:Uncharacterized protein n=1 Tax=Polychaeton citri CBS 116435 TaxID=1314669 RepID=A0A9P4UM68_9PEZI|nr:hypothetical protein K431DRAFT_85396 [Polychaeton citri CBS 116435]
MPPPQSATIAQAKRSYKERGQPQLTERDQKQLARAVELDRRAWRAKEQEKRKAEAIRKRAEKEKRSREAGERIQIDKQRKYDRFGFASSQAQLGKWFGGNAKPPEQDVAVGDDRVLDATEMFQDDLDDDDLINAAFLSEHGLQQSSSASMPTPTLTVNGLQTASKTAVPIHDSKELDLLGTDFESSTQVAEEIGQQASSAHVASELNNIPINCNTSFGSGDLDLSAEDLEALDPTMTVEAKRELDREIMPPPPVPARAMAKTSPVAAADGHTSSSSSKAHATNSGAVMKPPVTPPCPYDLGFTSSQLESFIDDDIQLTQACPG